MFMEIHECELYWRRGSDPGFLADSPLTFRLELDRMPIQSCS